MLRRVSPPTFVGLIKSAVRIALEGGQVDFGSAGVVVHASGNCEDPVPVSYELRGSLVEKSRIRGPIPYPDADNGLLFYEQTINPWKEFRDYEGRTISFRYRCRQCLPCLEVRSMSWRYRAEREIERHDRTWLVTFTYSDTWLAAYGGTDDTLRMMQKEATNFFKRLRKAGHKFRYKMVS